MGEAILVATDIISDPYPSISLIPPRVAVRFDRRTLPGETEEIILNQILNALKSVDENAFSLSVTRDTVQTYTGKVIEAPRLFAAWKVERDIPLVKAAQAGVIAAGLEPQFGFWGFCTNGSETAGKRKIPTIGLGPGLEDDAHITDESISVEALRQAKIAYEHLDAEPCHRLKMVSGVRCQYKDDRRQRKDRSRVGLRADFRSAGTETRPTSQC